MKKAIIIALVCICGVAHGQINPIAGVTSACETVAAFDTTLTPDVGIVIYTDDAETVWNALRLAVYSQRQGDLVVVFVTGKGLDAFMRRQDETDIFHVQAMSESFVANGGNIYSCASCAKVRGTDEILSCTITGIADLYQIMKRSKRVLTF